eukprot:tig00020610_g12040.t1
MITYHTDRLRDRIALIFRWRGSVYRRILGELFIFTAWGFFVAALEEWIDGSPEDEGGTTGGIAIPDKLHSFVFPMLGFLLVFRSQLAYTRFWDCRSALGVVAYSCRDLISQTLSYSDAGDERPESSRFRLNLVRLSAAFYSYATAYLNRKGKVTDHSFLSQWLLPAEVAKIESAKGNACMLLAHWVRREVSRLQQQRLIDPTIVMRFDDNVPDLPLPPDAPPLMLYPPQVTKIVVQFSVLDRHMRTPVPLPYTQALEIVLFMYFITLPFVFVRLVGSGIKRLVLLPVTMFVFTFTFYGIKTIAFELEDPLGDDDNDLPLGPMVESFFRDCAELYEDRQAEEPGLHWPSKKQFASSFALSCAPHLRARKMSRSNTARSPMGGLVPPLNLPPGFPGSPSARGAPASPLKPAASPAKSPGLAKAQTAPPFVVARIDVAPQAAAGDGALAPRAGAAQTLQPLENGHSGASHRPGRSSRLPPLAIVPPAQPAASPVREVPWASQQQPPQQGGRPALALQPAGSPAILFSPPRAATAAAAAAASATKAAAAAAARTAAAAASSATASAAAPAPAAGPASAPEAAAEGEAPGRGSLERRSRQRMHRMKARSGSRGEEPEGGSSVGSPARDDAGTPVRSVHPLGAPAAKYIYQHAP